MRFPFPSFVITVEKQEAMFASRQRTETLAGILVYPLPQAVSGSPAGDGIGIFAFQKDLGRYRPTTRDERERIAREYRGTPQRKARAANAILALSERTRGMSPDFSLLIPNALPLLVREEEPQTVVDRHQSFDPKRIERLLLGTVLYLQTLPVHSPHRADWRPLARTELPNPHPITGETQLCVLSSSRTLTSEIREQLLAEREQQITGRQIKTHFRTGYWRRRPGQGHIPDAPRIVWIHPTIVRRDRLREGEVPAGSVVKLN